VYTSVVHVIGIWKSKMMMKILHVYMYVIVYNNILVVFTFCWNFLAKVNGRKQNAKKSKSWVEFWITNNLFYGGPSAYNIIIFVFKKHARPVKVIKLLRILCFHWIIYNIGISIIKRRFCMMEFTQTRWNWRK